MKTNQCQNEDDCPTHSESPTNSDNLMDESEEAACYKCDTDVSINDKFFLECGTEAPSQGMSWGWRAQPDFGQLNALLEPYGVIIVEIETGTDQHALRVESSKSNADVEPPSERKANAQ